jgi:putative endopeptidase
MNRKTCGALVLACALAPLAIRADIDRPLKQLPYTPSLDVNAMDRSADPCVDFFQYSCGGWIRDNPIPADRASWSVYAKLAQENQAYLWGILEDLARSPARSPVQQKIGDYFAACMDEAAVERLGALPLKPFLDRIQALPSKRALAATLAELHASLGSGSLFFGFGAGSDYEDATNVIAFARAGGLGLPDRDYYIKDDAKSREMRGKYVAHVAALFGLLGEPAAAARDHAARVMAIETKLAGASLTRVERRDPHKLFHRMDRRDLKSLTRHFDWDLYLRHRNLPEVATFNVTEPDFYRELDRQLEALPLEDIRTYLRWHVASAAAPRLSKAFVNENFAFYDRTLHGTLALRPRWKRCVALVDGQLGEALGQEFVRRNFSPELKRRVQRMSEQIEHAMREEIDQLDWMGPATKARAKEKLSVVVNKIGYPDKWRDYSSVAVKRDDFFGNFERAQRFASHRDLAKVGKPLDRAEWFMTPPTVNAYFNSRLNDINFPAGVLQPPLYDPRMDDAPNYGNTGGTIGHELTHGFDDQGRKFDAKGNLRDWWTKEDDAAFRERAKCISDQFSTYTAVDDVRVNGQLTLGEDVADLGGLVLAWVAWKAETAGRTLEDRDGLTPEQRFFVGYSQWSCASYRPEEARLRALTDPHSPAKYRTNGLVVNMPQFERAFSCTPGQPMAAEKRCRVW